MARKTMTVVIDADGRDHGKQFLITEMSAAATEEWAVQAFLGLANGGAEIPEGMENAGFAGIAAMGISALGKMPFATAKPLLDQMFSCIKMMPDPSKPQIVRALVDDDIEEVPTRLKLRMAVWELHTGFLPAVAS